jgi:integrase
MLDVISGWVDWLRIDSAPTTVAAYEWELRHFEKWALSHELEVLSATKTDLARYLADRRVLQHASDATVRRSVNALRAFYKFSLGSKSPARTIKPPSPKKRKQRTLNWSQALDVMAACDTSNALGRRNLALICLGLDSGLREAELCRLSIAQLDLEAFRLTVRVKGGNDGDGIFGPHTVAALSSWLADRPAYAAPGVDTVFVSIGGDTPGRAITPSGLRCIFRRIGRQAGLEQGFSPHDLRRSFATMSHQLGAPTRIVQVAGRWSDLQMVERYTQALSVSDMAPYSPVSHILNPDS